MYNAANFVKITIYDTDNISHEFVEICGLEQKYVINDEKICAFCHKHRIGKIGKLKLSVNTHGISFYIKDYTMTDAICFDSYSEYESFIPYFETNKTDIFIQSLTIKQLVAKCSSIILSSCKINVLEGEGFQENPSGTRAESTMASGIHILRLEDSSIEGMIIHTSCDLLSVRNCQIHEIKETSSDFGDNLSGIKHLHASEKSIIDKITLQKATGKITLEDVTVRNIYANHPPVVQENGRDTWSNYLNTIKVSNDFFRVLKYIEDHYPENLKLSTLAEFFHLNANYLGQLFQKNLHTSFPKYLNIRRVANASAILVNSEIPISEIAVLVGYHDDCYFRKVFKMLTGETPASYRRCHRKVFIPQLQVVN